MSRGRCRKKERKKKEVLCHTVKCPQCGRELWMKKGKKIKCPICDGGYVLRKQKKPKVTPVEPEVSPEEAKNTFIEQLKAKVAPNVPEAEQKENK